MQIMITSLRTHRRESNLSLLINNISTALLKVLHSAPTCLPNTIRKQRKGANLGFGLIQTGMSPRNVSIRSLCPSYRQTRGAPFNERCVENEAILFNGNTLNNRKSTVHHSSLVRKLREISPVSISQCSVVQCLH